MFRRPFRYLHLWINLSGPKMLFHAILLATLVFYTAHAAVNEPCYGSGGVAGMSSGQSYSGYLLTSLGVCLSTTTCSASGGTTFSGACPSDPADVKCCSKPSCGASPGNCRWSSDCAASSLSNLCPGPSGFKCCQSSATGFGGYAAPAFPVVGSCKSVAVEGAKKIVAAFPGRVREIFCTRDCTCSSTPSSDHCCGKATDMMCSDAGGVRAGPLTVSGFRTD
jgi:hypothetical protein